MLRTIPRRHFCNVPWEGNFGWYLKSLHSRLMLKTEYGMLNNTLLQCYISPLFCIRICLSSRLTTFVRPLSNSFIYPPLLVMWTPVAQIHFNTCVCWLEICVRTTSLYRYILLHNISPFELVPSGVYSLESITFQCWFHTQKLHSSSFPFSVPLWFNNFL